MFSNDEVKSQILIYLLVSFGVNLELKTKIGAEK